ncbi:MAG: hypothetical protein A2Y07_01685 [Planctomycetes bacterium GWF2_50_10]|nr:MAG: hypothetical protein A2Y07_01685 [Planctomycetes bacterium GWF2_50_10]
MKLAQFTGIFLVTATLIISGGCSGSKETGAISTADRQARLQTIEYPRLKKQFENLQAKLADKQSELDKCNKEKAGIEKNADELVAFVMEEVTKSCKEECEKVKQENASLRQQLGMPIEPNEPGQL